MPGTNFGAIALALGYLTPQQLATVTAIQHEEAAQLPMPRTFGAICRDLGFLSEAQILMVLDGQEIFPPNGPEVEPTQPAVG